MSASSPVIDGLLGLTRAGRMHLARRRVDVSQAARRAVAKLRAREPDRRVVVEIAEGLEAWADEALVAVVLDQLLGNAWKYTRRTADARVEVGARRSGGSVVFHVRDNGVGFDMARAGRLFTPFARLQGSTTAQAGFSEWGADSLDLTVASQTTSSLRTTLGAELQNEFGPVDLHLRLGWLHEYADTARPMTASFAGAPGVAFTVFGATPQRDSAAIGFSGCTKVGESTELYARYDGEVGGGSDNHAFNVGLRMVW